MAAAPAAIAAPTKAQAVGLAAGNGDEHVAGFDGAAVRGHAADVEIGVARVEFRVRRQNLAKLHGGSESASVRGGSVDDAASIAPYLLSFSEASIS